MTQQEKDILNNLCDVLNSVIGAQVREMGVTWCSSLMNKVNDSKEKLKEIKTGDWSESFDPKNQTPIP